MTTEELRWLEQEVGRLIIAKLWSDLEHKFMKGTNDEKPNGILASEHRERGRESSTVAGSDSDGDEIIRPPYPRCGSDWVPPERRGQWN